MLRPCDCLRRVLDGIVLEVRLLLRHITVFCVCSED